MSNVHRVKALARMSVGLDPQGGSLMLEHLLDRLDTGGIDPRELLPLPDGVCPGDDHRGGCPVAFAWQVRALGWMCDLADAVEAGEPEPPAPPPAPGCYPRWTKHTAHPLRRKR